MTLKVTELSDNKWPDLDVSSWPVVEKITEKMQTDGYIVNIYYITNIAYN